MTDKAICDDGDNTDLYGKDITGAILCLPQTIGSTTGGFVLMGVAKMGVGPQGDAVLQARGLAGHRWSDNGGCLD